MSDEEDDFAAQPSYGPSHFSIMEPAYINDFTGSRFEYLDFSKVASSTTNKRSITNKAGQSSANGGRTNKRFKQAVLCLSEDMQLSLALSLSMMPSEPSKKTKK